MGVVVGQFIVALMNDVVAFYAPRLVYSSCGGVDEVETCVDGGVVDSGWAQNGVEVEDGDLGRGVEGER